MAELISKEKYKGKLGELDFYQLNGKTVVRVRRSKLSKGKKRKMAKTRSGKAHASNVMGSKFGKALRDYVHWRHQADTYYHSAMTGHIGKHVLVPTPEKGGIGTRSVLAENVHRISSFTANPEIPEKVLDALRKTKFERGKDGITAVVPEIPVEMLTGSKSDQYRVWVMLKYIDLDKTKLGWSHRVDGAAVPMGEKGSVSMVFSTPAGKANEVLVAVVGVQSLFNGRMVEDVRMNGFVFLSVELGVGSSELGIRSELGVGNLELGIGGVTKVQSATDNSKLATGNGQKAMGNEQLAIGKVQLAIDKDQSATDNRQLATGNWQKAMGNEQSGIGNTQSAICNAKSAISNLSDEGNKGQLATDKGQFAMGHHLLVDAPAAPVRQRAVSSPDPQLAITSPALQDLQPAVGERATPSHLNLPVVGESEAPVRPAGVSRRKPHKKENFDFQSLYKARHGPSEQFPQLPPFCRP